MAKRIERCPCGSGKTRSECCDGKVRRRVRLIVTMVFALASAGVATALGLSFARGDERVAIPVPLAEGATPTPYEFDPVNNRHWDPEHGHWHPGLPPDIDADITSDIATDIGQPLADGAATPTPWSYDAVNDRHWHPGHGHWHDGPPPYTHPDVAAAQTPEQLALLPERVLNPTPYWYDPSVDMYWDPGHEHWHTGPPPGP